MTNKQRPDKPVFIIAETLSGEYAIVEKKYVCNSIRPTYTIISQYPTKQAAMYAIGLIR